MSQKRWMACTPGSDSDLANSKDVLDRILDGSTGPANIPFRIEAPAGRHHRKAVEHAWTPRVAVRPRSGHRLLDRFCRYVRWKASGTPGRSK
jgi:hypothetical protein